MSIVILSHNEAGILFASLSDEKVKEYVLDHCIPDDGYAAFFPLELDDIVAQLDEAGYELTRFDA